jgi:hypothetical protein
MNIVIYDVGGLQPTTTESTGRLLDFGEAGEQAIGRLRMVTRRSTEKEDIEHTPEVAVESRKTDQEETIAKDRRIFPSQVTVA